MRDLPLYYGLLTIMVVGVGTSMYQLYKLANKKNCQSLCCCGDVVVVVVVVMLLLLLLLLLYVCCLS